MVLAWGKWPKRPKSALGVDASSWLWRTSTSGNLIPSGIDLLTKQAEADEQAAREKQEKLQL